MTAARSSGPGTERGAVGGIEVLPFGLLIFVVGSLLIANLWAVVDAKLAVESAAREAGRAYVEAGDPAAATHAANQAAAAAMAGAGRDPNRAVVRDNHPRYVRCAVVEHEVSYRLPFLTVPFLGGLGHGTTVRGRHRELIDPYVAGLGQERDCA